LTIFENFIESGESENIFYRMKYYKHIYTKLIDKLARFDEYLRRYMSRMDSEVLNFCYISAKKLIKYDIRSHANTIKNSIETVYEFYSTTYKSFYCVLCNGDSHLYISNSYKTINLKGDFCK